MSNYNHEEKTLDKALNLSVDALMEKVQKIYDKESDEYPSEEFEPPVSKYIELLETGFSIKELAILAGLFIKEAMEYRSKEKAETISNLKDSIPEGIPEEVKNSLLKILSQGDTCDCPKCVQRRKEEAAKEGVKSISIHSNGVGEGGDA